MLANLSLANDFFKSQRAYRRALKARPISAALAITNRCNLRCNYCNTPFLPYDNEMSLAQVQQVLEKLKNLGVSRIGITGGEPLVRNDLSEIISYSKSGGFYVTLNTNLTLFKKHQHDLEGVDLFFTSLDGNQEMHELHRGRGSYKGLIEGISELKKLKKKLVAICVLTNENLAAIDFILDLAEEYGFKIHFQARCFDTAIVRGEPSKIDRAAHEKLRTAWQKLLVAKKMGRPIASSKLYFEQIINWHNYFETSLYDENRRCAAGYGFLYVDPTGLAWPCAYTKGKTEPVDLKTEDFDFGAGDKTPCTSCIVGPHLEFSLLYEHPLKTALDLAGSYF